MAYVCGYGRYVDNSQIVSRHLRWTHVKIIENEECQRDYGDEVVVESTMCAISIHLAGQNTCNGDSGGSLVLREGDVYKQVGIISFAAADQCGAGYPSGFMRVRSHLRWIYSVMLNYVENSNYAQGGYVSNMHKMQELQDSKYAGDYDENYVELY